MQNEMSNIWNNRLFLGSQYSSCKHSLIKHQISHVISIGCDSIDECDDVVNYKFEVDDNAPNLQLFFETIVPQIHELINALICQNEKNKVLVHCQAGISRSATAVITWLMRWKQMDYHSAFNHVKKCRPVISPNVMFAKHMRRTQCTTTN